MTNYPYNRNDLKTYQCTGCGHESEHDTNHYGSIYPFCKICNKQTPHKFTGDLPEGAWTPEPFGEVTVKKMPVTRPREVLTSTSKNREYDLEYWVGGKCIQSIMTKRAYGSCKWKKEELLKTGNYNKGKLLILRK